MVDERLQTRKKDLKEAMQQQRERMLGK